MQTLDVISVNLWQIIISLLNLVILFIIVKQFLYKPVKKMLAQRQSTIDGRYREADDAKSEALSAKEAYNAKLEAAESEAETIVKSAVETARARENEIIAQAKMDAKGIIEEAQKDAELELRKAEATVRDEIADVSALLTEKLLEREINKDDHRAMIDKLIEEIGEENDGDK